MTEAKQAKLKVGFISLGCPKNRVDSEIALGHLSEIFSITPVAEEADIIIVNTCGFIASAKKEAIETILKMAQYKTNKCKLLAVTGCLTERYRSMVLDSIPEVDLIIGTRDYYRINELILNKLNNLNNKTENAFFSESNDMLWLDSKRIRTTTGAYGYLKISEGCSNCCSYCAIPMIRGSYRSRTLESLILEAEVMADTGIKEIVLVAQDTTLYGVDIYKERKLTELIRSISKINGVEWVRVLYAYPDGLTDELINEMELNDKFLNYIDIPLQHASDRILKLMGRKCMSGETIRKIDLLRKRIPDVTIRTTLMTGFPGETQDDFNILKEFVRNSKFDRLGVFEYSEEEGTLAAGFNDRIKKSVKRKRKNEIMELQHINVMEINSKLINRTFDAFVDGSTENGKYYLSRTYRDAPEIDGYVMIKKNGIQKLNPGDKIKTKIISHTGYDLIGEVSM